MLNAEISLEVLNKIIPVLEAHEDYTNDALYELLCGFAKENGYKVIAATNPIFPKPATYKRLEWAGLNPEDFEYITVYDNSSSCKPNLLYFKDLCEKCSISPKESLMVGNDVDEDLCSAELGFDTFLITDCIINRNDKDYSSYKNGSFEDFYNYLTTLNK